MTPATAPIAASNPINARPARLPRHARYVAARTRIPRIVAPTPTASSSASQMKNPSSPMSNSVAASAYEPTSARKTRAGGPASSIVCTSLTGQPYGERTASATSIRLPPLACVVVDDDRAVLPVVGHVEHDLVVEVVRKYALSDSEDDRKDHQAQHVDQIPLEQTVDERVAPMGQDVPLDLILEARNVVEALQDRRVLPGRLLERRGDHVLRHRVEPLGEGGRGLVVGLLPLGPRRREALVGNAAEQHHLGLVRLLRLDLVLALVRELERPRRVLVALLTAWRFHDAVHRDELRDDQSSHRSTSSWLVFRTDPREPQNSSVGSRRCGGSARPKGCSSPPSRSGHSTSRSRGTRSRTGSSRSRTPPSASAQPPSLSRGSPTAGRDPCASSAAMRCFSPERRSSGSTSTQSASCTRSTSRMPRRSR